MIVGVVPVGDSGVLEHVWGVLNAPLVDVVELRLDYLGSVDEMLSILREVGEAGLLERSIVTVRAWWEGGRARIDDEERVRILTAALDQGAALIDLEVLTLDRMGKDVLRGLDWGRVLLSLHAPLGEVSEGLAEYLLARASSLGAWGVKLAVYSRSWSGRLSSLLYWFLSEALERGIRAAAMPYGCCTGLRLSLYASGSSLLYTCVSRRLGCTAPGQPLLEDDTWRSLVEAAVRLKRVVGLEG